MWPDINSNSAENTLYVWLCAVPHKIYATQQTNYITYYMSREDKVRSHAKFNTNSPAIHVREMLFANEVFLFMLCLFGLGDIAEKGQRGRGRNAIWRHHNSYSTVSKIWIWIWIAWCDLYFCNNIRIVCSCRSSQLVASKIANIFEQWSQIADRKALRSDIDRCTIIRSLAVRYNFRSLSKFHIFSTIIDFAIAPILLLIAKIGHNIRCPTQCGRVVCAMSI